LADSPRTEESDLYLCPDGQISVIDVYTEHPLQQILSDVIKPGLPAAAWLGVHWFHSRPPVKEIEFEMDMRGVVQDITLDLE